MSWMPTLSATLGCVLEALGGRGRAPKSQGLVEITD